MGKAYVYVGTNSLRGSQGIYTLSLDTQSGIMEVIDTAGCAGFGISLPQQGRQKTLCGDGIPGVRGKKGRRSCLLSN